MCASEALINSMNVIKRKAHETQQPRHIHRIDREVSNVQKSDFLVQ